MKEVGQHPQFLGNGCDRIAIAARIVADHQVDLLAFDKTAIFRKLLLRAAGLIDEYRLDLQTIDARLVVRSRNLAGVERLDDQLGSVTGMRPVGRARSRQKKYETDFQLFLRGRRLKQRAGNAGQHGSKRAPSTKTRVHRYPQRRQSLFI